MAAYRSEIWDLKNVHLYLRLKKKESSKLPDFSDFYSGDQATHAGAHIPQIPVSKHSRYS